MGPKQRQQHRGGESRLEQRSDRPIGRRPVGRHAFHRQSVRQPTGRHLPNRQLEHDFVGQSVKSLCVVAKSDSRGPGFTSVDIVFDATDAYNNPSDVRINYSPQIQGLYINNIGTTSLTTASATTPQTITLGGDGFTAESVVGQSSGQAVNSANVLTIGPTSVSPNTWAPLTLALSSSQTWANYSPIYPVTFTSPIRLASAAAGDPLTVTTSTLVTLTTGGYLDTGANNHLNGGINENGGTGVLGFVVSSGLWTFGAGGTTVPTSNFSGGVLVEPVRPIPRHLSDRRRHGNDHCHERRHVRGQREQQL